MPDIEEATQEVERLGGRWLEARTTRELDGFTWRCMADPEDDEFDIDVLRSASSPGMIRRITLPR